MTDNYSPLTDFIHIILIRVRIERVSNPDVHLGCNFMSLGGDRAIVPKSSQTLVQRLRAHGLEVVEVDMSEISKTGGGIHCMAQALRREPGA